MASERAMYWMAVGLMALLLGNHFAAKYNRCLRGSIAGAQDVLERTPNLVPPERFRAPVAAQLASMQAKIAHQRAAYASLQAQRAQMMAIEQMEVGRLRGIFPREPVKIRIPEPPAPIDGSI
jgi:hypothetical protein